LIGVYFRYLTTFSVADRGLGGRERREVAEVIRFVRNQDSFGLRHGEPLTLATVLVLKIVLK
jgi:hypothetical protein